MDDHVFRQVGSPEDSSGGNFSASLSPGAGPNLPPQPIATLPDGFFTLNSCRSPTGNDCVDSSGTKPSDQPSNPEGASKRPEQWPTDPPEDVTLKDIWKMMAKMNDNGDFTWNSMSGRSVRLKSVPIQSLSELERARFRKWLFYRLQQDYDLGCQITIPKDGQKRKKSLRKKLDSLGKEKNKDKEFLPQAFGMPLSQVIVNDRAQKLKQDTHREEQRDVADSLSSLLTFGTKKQNKELSSSNSSLSSTSETPNESTSPNTPEPAPRARRRGAMSVDSITDLDDNQSRLLEALQLSLPAEAQSKKEKERDKKLSLNPIYRQVPRVVDSCCQHLEKNGLQTVGIFRVGSSKKRVRQLREDFDRGIDVVLEEEHSVHDVSALLKEFLRDMPDPLLTKELYTAFINTMLLEPDEQICTLQLLIYLLPPCNCDTLQRLLQFLSTVANHAEDTVDKDGQEVMGNKMTSLNLATIFGPNLLHKQKSSDKEFSVQSSARAEESTIIIVVLQKMIESYETLFMVPPDLQNEVLISLLETDPDVVDYLLRRKASQSSSPELRGSEGPFCIEGRHSSTDSNKASSGDVSPYDNNSPVLSERSLRAKQEDEVSSSDHLFKVPEQYTLVGHMQPKSRDVSAGLWAGKDIPEDHFNIWGTWHSTLKSSSKDQGKSGSYGNIYESPSLDQGQCYLSQGNLSQNCPRWQDTPEELDNGKPAIRRIHTSAAIPEHRPHPIVARVSSTPQIATNRGSLDQSCAKSEQHLTSSSTEDITEEELEVSCFQNKAKPSHLRKGDVNRNDARLPPPYPGSLKQSSAVTQRPTMSSAEQALWRLQRSGTNSRVAEEGGGGGPRAISTDWSTLSQERQAPQNEMCKSCSIPTNNQNSNKLAEQDWQEWQRERWQIWELLSADNSDALPETLV
ncbi:LOW QUALITY PROTEIN: rho GTPase-activating protein 6 [Rhinatrema bivittatum]|uniref:LOW QUALITY PROTEIN: rho GTPase-activating protein 6 n=1 Tax=Rhinatrema bivittatum TaxID=194408 RepID=UPI00112E69C7|nr:LOW QUALITY PROTEIN: rho GTPase-activating protein 6 [Rhinatrema bivittatum]